jgi:lipid A 3-O-deacylase
MKNKLYLFIPAVLGLWATMAPSASAEPTLEQSIPQRVFDGPKKKIITLVVENDSLGGGTDKNYSSGVRINFTNTDVKFPDIAHRIDKMIPTFEINRTSSIHYSFGQNLYTPRDVTRASLDPDDRPWAAFLYGSLGMVTLTGNHADEVEATLGVIGPAALGKVTQKFVHKHLTDSLNPKGWSNQLKNEPGVMLAWQRSWPIAISGRVDDNFWSIKPYVGATAGNIYTYGSAGFTLRLSPYHSRWQDTPLRVRPSMPGTGIYEIPSNTWSWALFSGIETRAVARNIFLDGNTFTNSHSVDKEFFVIDATAGAALTFKNTRLSYTLVYRTDEFKKQDDPEIFGALSLGLRF